jgi:NAD(P)-dependent dehydrogenase (short-subunit alcohol dehydrogenase family)
MKVRFLPAFFFLMPSDLEITLATLQRWADDPSLIDALPRAKTLVAKIHKQGNRAAKLGARTGKRDRDRQKRESTGLVASQNRPFDAPALPVSNEPQQLERAATCAHCRAPFWELHPFYHSLCPSCAELNWTKRGQSADLRGRIALLTGGRIKIGFECALKMLRDGARVIVTTRFADDARRRFERQSDFDSWRERLEIHALDLRFLGEVEAFCAHLSQTLPHLDILIGNAAQTIKRPAAFYAHLLQEAGFASSSNQLPLAREEPSPSPGPKLEKLEEDELSLAHYFPPSRLDRDEQQLDLRPRNSWTHTLGETSTREAAECYVVGALSSFVLAGQLRPLMKRSPHPRRFLVLASAMEGNFSRTGKTTRHPHTNMTKAALNMLVRTSAPDLKLDGIWCNAVDTGWITDENPHPLKARLRENGFIPPLDSLDGAARLLDPVYRGLDESEEPLWGHFLKDYEAHEW